MNPSLKLSPFSIHFRERERFNYYGSVFIGLDFDSKMDISEDEFKNFILKKLLLKEKSLRAFFVINEDDFDDYNVPTERIYEFGFDNKDQYNISQDIMDHLVCRTDFGIESDELFAQCTKNSFLPTYTGTSVTSSTNTETILENFNQTMNKWAPTKFLSSQINVVPKNQLIKIKDEYVFPHYKFAFSDKSLIFMYSHVFFDGMAGVSVLDKVLCLINEYTAFRDNLPNKLQFEKSSIVQEMFKTADETEKLIKEDEAILDVYPWPTDEEKRQILEENKETKPPVQSKYLLKGDSELCIKPNNPCDHRHLLLIENKDLKKLLTKAKSLNVSLTALLYTFWNISFHQPEKEKTKTAFFIPADLRGRINIGNDKYNLDEELIIPKNTVGCAISFYNNQAPIITDKECVLGSKEFVELANFYNTAINDWVRTEKLSDLSFFKNVIGTTDQRKLFSGYTNLYNENKPKLLPSNYAMSNLGVNFVHKQEYSINVEHSVFGQAMRVDDFVTSSIISSPKGMCYHILYRDNSEKFVSKVKDRFIKNLYDFIA
ncbi:hypothetical protein FOG51_04074 [Hanseniaspora uvarum]|nr:hypothetical protein FOG51_04074 [Hanseniaspora uvarum]